MDNLTQEGRAMIAPRTFTRTLVASIICMVLLALTSASSAAWAGVAADAEPTVAVADLEHLVQQIEDPQQRTQLLKTLQALIIAAKQAEAGGPPPEQPAPSAEQWQGVFFAFGEFTQYVATIGRMLSYSLASLPVMLGELPARLREPATMWFALYFVLAGLILVACGIVLQFIADRLKKKLCARILATEPIPIWRKAWLSLITISLAVAPYIALLVVSAIVLSILALGAVSSGLVALIIVTLILYQLLRAVALVLLNPDRPSARLLPIRDATARQAWSWAICLSIFAAGYFLITRALLTIGVAWETYQVVRGLMVLLWAIGLSILVLHLARAQRASVAPPLSDVHRRRWTGVIAVVQRAWPIIAIAYIWCIALLALFRAQQGAARLGPASVQTALVIAAGFALLWVGEHLFTRAVALNDLVGRYIPGLEARTLRYLRALWWSIRVLIIVAAIVIIIEAWGVDIARFFTSPVGGDILSRLITLLVTAAVVLFIIDLTAFIGEELIKPMQGGEEASKKRKTLVPLMATTIKYATLLTGGLVILHLMGVNITPILAGVGILGLAVGFGAQTLVKDIINGLFILVEDSIAVGDVITVRGTGGLVEAVNLRTIWLRDLQGSVHIIPNSQVDIITNMTKDYAYYVLDVNVAYREDTDAVIVALQEIDAEMRADPAFATDMLAPIEIMGVERFDDSAVVVRARLKTRPIKQWSVGREYNRRMKKLFDARGIEIPFPHRTLYWGQPKHGEAPALQLHIRNREALATTIGQDKHQAVTPSAEASDM
jgi:small conductance mechanosensitive channel